MRRRSFLHRSLSGTVGAALGAMNLNVARLPSAEAGARKRRHLINLVVGTPEGSGWDISWFHQAVPMARLDPAKVTISTAISGFPEAQFLDQNLLKFTQKHQDASGMYHRDGKTFFGAAWASLFRDSASLHDRMLFWRGLFAEGGHLIGNQLLMNGSISSYALSYSAVVAQGLAQHDYPRQLHYVMLANSPADVFTSLATATGYAVPISVGGWDGLKSMTTVPATDFQDSRRGMIDAAISKLSGALLSSTYTTAASREIVSLYGRNLGISLDLSSSGLATGKDFLSTWASYALSMATALKTFLTPSASDSQLKISERLAFGSLGGLPALLNNSITNLTNQLNGPLAPGAPPLSQAAGTALAAVLASYDVSGTFLMTMAFRYALAEYLVRNDHSAVVDVGVPFYDFHGNYMSELVWLFTIMAGYRQLLASLAGTPLTTGGTLLDCTQVVMHCDLDRDFNHNSNVSPGTDHSYNHTAVLLAGYGVRGGSVVGGIAETLGEATAHATGLFSPLPIDPATGLPAPGGKLIGTRSLFPTIVNSFGFEVPLQQISDAEAVAAVIAKAQ